MAGTPLTIVTWNIGHLSGSNKAKESKVDKIAELLNHGAKQVGGKAPDVLVLQEVNSEVDQLHEVAGKFGYVLDMGPWMQVDKLSANNPKDAVQNEYYPAYYNRKTISLDNTYILQNPYREKRSSDDKEVKGRLYQQGNLLPVYDLQEGKAYEWGQRRQVVVRSLNFLLDDFKFLLGVVHTTPGTKSDIRRDSMDYLSSMAINAEEMPWILAGDWYVADEIENTARRVWELETKPSWPPVFLEEQAASRVNPLPVSTRGLQPTDIPSKGIGMTADYFMVPERHFLIEKCIAKHAEDKPIIFSPRGMRTAVKQANEYRILYSDHLPVVGSFILQPPPMIVD